MQSKDDKGQPNKWKRTPIEGQNKTFTWLKSMTEWIHYKIKLKKTTSVHWDKKTEMSRKWHAWQKIVENKSVFYIPGF